jgi:hypothetical protein
MPSSTIWLSFDLGVRGDYEGMYAWLDSRHAKECVQNVALLVYKYKHAGALVASLQADLKKSVEIGKRARVYVIYRDSETTRMKGFFLFGGRRTPVWAGYSGEGEEQEDDES